MEYIRRFSSFLSKLNCNNTECVNTKKGFQKCNDGSNQEHTNDIDLNKSVHLENDLLELIEPKESNEPLETNELMVSTDINVDDFDEYHNHEIIDSYDNFSNVVVQPVD